MSGNTPLKMKPHFFAAAEPVNLHPLLPSQPLASVRLLRGNVPAIGFSHPWGLVCVLRDSAESKSVSSCSAHLPAANGTPAERRLDL